MKTTIKTPEARQVNEQIRFNAVIKASFKIIIKINHLLPLIVILDKSFDLQVISWFSELSLPLVRSASSQFTVHQSSVVQAVNGIEHCRRPPHTLHTFVSHDLHISRTHTRTHTHTEYPLWWCVIQMESITVIGPPALGRTIIDQSSLPPTLLAQVYNPLQVKTVINQITVDPIRGEL